MNTNREKLMELVLKALPYSEQLTDLNFESEVDTIRFTWREVRYRVTNTLYVEEVQDGILASTDRTILMQTLLARAKYP